MFWKTFSWKLHKYIRPKQTNWQKIISHGAFFPVHLRHLRKNNIFVLRSPTDLVNEKNICILWSLARKSNSMGLEKLLDRQIYLTYFPHKLMVSSKYADDLWWSLKNVYQYLNCFPQKASWVYFSDSCKVHIFISFVFVFLVCLWFYCYFQFKNSGTIQMAEYGQIWPNMDW